VAKARSAPAAASRVSGLNDAPFAEAVEGLTSICQEACDELGSPLTLAELLEIVVEGVRGVRPELLQMPPDQLLVGFRPILTKSTGKLVWQVGDICAIPRKAGGYCLGVFLENRRQIGPMFGFFAHVFSSPRPRRLATHPVLPHAWPMILLAEGNAVVRRVGNDPSLVARFPANREIFCEPDDSTNSKEYGYAVSSSDAIRQLTKQEADEIGLFSVDFRQVLSYQDVEGLVDRAIARLSR
jgi:hypothetical protein